jgi:hypothetical protein
VAEYILGLDLGQSQDYSALVLIERIPPQRDETPMQVPVVVPSHLHVRYAHRWQLGTSYVQVAKDVATRLNRAPVNGAGKLIVDRTGIGQAVVDFLRGMGLKPVPVHVHGGSELTAGSRGGWNCPKRDLVGAVEILLQQGRLEFAKRMPLMPALLQELTTFRAKINDITAHDSYSAWREQDHDDLVFALALAVWWGERFGAKSAQMIPMRF